MEELIKKQIEIENKIEVLHDESDKIGEEICATFERLSRKEKIECYHLLPTTSTKYKVFCRFIEPLLDEE
ncbi:hypothetical protein Bcp1_157 [Bacillus phage Bcp1]|uniref:Uncharacterized protein n=1 Tax=Bacillus phage Bcp1 TaxID=584892 RepID=X2JMZ3_9CAUD|nr:hypothetical protein Bcp1_157 [Bacillus phage Bcp1]AHN66632.1 hypothetical protein Bcp1_157 [Bacillus phage Bcp1]